MLSTLFSETPRWQAEHQALAKTLTRQWRDWLFDRGSLTQRLIAMSNNAFRVDVLKEDWRSPTLDERHALELTVPHRALVREVALLCHEKPVVYARSILPLSTLEGENQHLKQLGSSPLGAALFSSPSLTRGPVFIAKINSLKTEISITKTNPAYARRSIFYLSGKPLLVSEIFLPTLIASTK